MESTEVNLLADIEATHLVQASHGKRLGNYIIDLIIFYIAIFTFSFLLATISPAFVDWIDNYGNDTGFNIADRLVSLFIYGLLMGLIEAVSKGRSLGKLITGTKAINQDGSTISAGTAFLRGLSRAVPFNALSALGTPPFPWHDKWTKTFVIDIKASNIDQK